MKHTKILIQTTSDLVTTAVMLELANPLYPMAELLERELMGRRMLKDDDLIVWDIKAIGTGPWSGHGFVHWLRPAEDPTPAQGRLLWHNANFGDGVWPIPANQLYDSLGCMDAHFNRSGCVSMDSVTWAFPTSSPIVGQYADLFTTQAEDKIAVAK